MLKFVQFQVFYATWMIFASLSRLRALMVQDVIPIRPTARPFAPAQMVTKEMTALRIEMNAN